MIVRLWWLLWSFFVGGSDRAAPCRSYGGWWAFSFYLHGCISSFISRLGAVFFDFECIQVCKIWLWALIVFTFLKCECNFFPFLSYLSKVFYIKPAGYALSCTSSISGGQHNTLNVEKLCRKIMPPFFLTNPFFFFLNRLVIKNGVLSLCWFFFWLDMPWDFLLTSSLLLLVFVM